MSGENALIKGGIIVDGTGAPAFPADIRVANGRIAEIGQDLPPKGETVFDASGCHVTPGFIDTHTHYDASLFWEPACDPITHHGVTTVLIGNCGLGLAPIRPAEVAGLSRLFAYIEDLPQEVFALAVPWNWESFPDYVAAMKARPFGVNVTALVSHSLLRMFVMGKHAWSRAAIEQERYAIADLADQALAAGAMGISTSRFDRDPDGKQVPSFFADEAELEALFQVAARHGAIFQMIPDLSTLETHVADLRRMGRLSARYDTPVISNAIYERPDDPAYAPALLDVAREIRAAGARFHFLASPRSIELLVNFHQCMVFIYVPAWNELVQAGLSREEKLAKLRSPEWRARARADWDAVTEGFPSGGMERMFRIVKVGKPELDEHLGKTFDTILDQKTGHVSDILADWVLDNDLDAEFVYPFTNTDLDMVAKLLAAEESIISGSDAGAHIGMFDGAGDTTLVLTRHVRDRGDLSLESAVRRMTLDQAQLLGLADRGVIRPGAIADLAIFDLDRLEWASESRVKDVPGGNMRFRRESKGFRYTFIAGTLVQQDGVWTHALPAEFLGGEASRRSSKDSPDGPCERRPGRPEALKNTGRVQ